MGLSWPDVAGLFIGGCVVVAVVWIMSRAVK